jgi:hypothetical protein
MLDRHAALVAALPRASGTILAATAHLPSLERPDLFNPPLLAFLATMKPH